MATQTPYNIFAGAAALANGVIWRNLGPLINFTRPLGNVWWVDSNIGSDSNSYGSSRGNYPHRPFATVAHAISAATANNGDLIMVAPNHTETLATAGAWTVPAGVQIIGYQAKDGDRPQIKFSAAAASILMSGANSSLSGLVLSATGGVSGTVVTPTNPINITAADCSVDVEWRDAQYNEAARAILTSAGGINLNINLKYVGISGSSVNVNAIRLVGSKNNRINIDYFGTPGTGCIEFLTTAGTNTVITGTINNSAASTTHAKNIVDTVTGSHYFANYFDACSNATTILVQAVA
jgi:hypothetical protein